MKRQLRHQIFLSHFSYVHANYRVQIFKFHRRAHRRPSPNGIMSIHWEILSLDLALLSR